MKTLTFFQMAEIEAGGPGFWCVTSIVGWVGSLCALACFTGGLGALLGTVGGHIVSDISGGVSCAQWIASLKDDEEVEC